MNLKLTALIGLSALGLASTAGAQITFYEGEGFRGRAFTSSRQVRNFQRAGFNNRARSSWAGDSGRCATASASRARACSCASVAMTPCDVWE